HAQPSDAMRRFVARYAVGQDVMVWYEPSDPRRSYLQINFASGRIMRWAVASLVLCGASLIGYALR
ncbi:MAG TPA: DUF3592 domain-containing protein, partial [Steroidobacteraceae bacterium]|nr:DUF3592 domain-containing protein [Steroidobacteraceae bacterium]